MSNRFFNWHLSFVFEYYLLLTPEPFGLNYGRQKGNKMPADSVKSMQPTLN
ncbi:hypothetical protein D1BOALGB6SA_6793 [Olavius sp. associated proteobacterium Delta 1]|nr:hypothetical protein D1BOALGB6SA_6793 [Olavius sp. associated proteobacterium Delta 1]